MQIKSTMRYHLTPVRELITTKTKDDKFGGGFEEMGDLYTVGGIVTGTAIMENNMEIPQNTKNRITI